MKNILIGVVITLFIVAIGIGAFMLGQKTVSKETNNTQANVAPKTLTQTPTSAVTPTEGEKNTKTVEAGGALSFTKYSLTLPQGWEQKREQGENSDKLTLTKLGYKLEIYEAAFGGGGCLFPGDPPSEMAQTFTSFTEIVNPNGYVFRRAISSPNTYTVCQKNNIDGSFGAPTQFGAISFTTPGTPDKNAIVFPEVDAILSSIKK